MAKSRQPFLDASDARLTRTDDGCGSRDQRTYRLITDEERAEERRIVSSVFYGYPAELIAEWCLVDVDTAVRWKMARTTPSRQALRLFELHKQRRVLGDSWAGWIVKGDRLVDPEDNETTQGQLRAYALVYQHYRELMRDNEAAKQRFQEIMREAG